MENIPKDSIKLLYEEGTKIIPNSNNSYINPYIEWIKWLEYKPNFDLEGIDKQIELSKLFKKYGTKDITEKEYFKVYNYMKNNSLEELIKSKLSKEEVDSAKEKIDYYKTIPKEELRDKVDIERREDNYKELSMFDSYILHEISKIDSLRNFEDLRRIIESSHKDNIHMSHRSMINALKPNKNN